MAAKIGILGESTATAVTITTVYTCPSDKGARIRIIWAAEVAASGNTVLRLSMASPGTEHHRMREQGATVDAYTGLPYSAQNASNVIGIMEESMGRPLVAGAANHEGATIMPWPHDWYLSDGDTIRVDVGTTALADHLFQCVGSEDDA